MGARKRAFLVLLLVLTATMPLSLLLSSVEAAVGTPTQTLVASSYRPWHHWARSTFKAEGRWFVGLYLSSNMYYTHSTDRVTWASPVLIGSAEASYDCGWWYNGTHVAYVRIPAANDNIYFRQGVPQSDGTISWDAAEQTVDTDGVNDFYMASIAIDNQGYAWITCNFSPGAGGGTPRVWRNDNRDGTWSTTAAFPYQLSATNKEVRTVIAPVSTNKVLVFWGSINDDETGLYSRFWDGSAWEATITVASDLEYTFQAVSIEASDNAWVVWGAYDSGVYHRISGRKWNATSKGWDTKVNILDAFQFGTNVAIAYEVATSDFRVFYQDKQVTKDFFQIRYSDSGGSWGNSIRWYDDTLIWSGITISITPFRHDYNGEFGISHRHYKAPNTKTYFIGEIPTAPSVDTATITNMDYGDWVITNTKYYTFWANYTHTGGYEALSIMKIAFTDGATWINASYDADADTWTLDSGTGYVYIADGTASGSGDVLNVTFPMFLTNDVLDAFDVDLYLFCEDNESQTDGWTLTDADHFNIYNLGETFEYDYGGDGYKIDGGGPFDVGALNGTAGSSARVNMYVVNFQHLNTLVHLWQDASWNASEEYWDCITEHNQTGYLEYGVDYYINDSWVEGWRLHLEVINASAGTFGIGSDEAYVILNASWYNRGDVVKSDTLVVMYEAYTALDVTTRFTLWVDLWISNLEGSSMVGGHVSAQFYGMTETGWWLWADWGPIYGTLTSSSFMDNLQDASNETIQAPSLYLFRVWTKLAKTAAGEGTDCDTHLWTTDHEVGPNIRALPSTENLTGIVTPTIQPTTTPDMPIGYFPSLASSLIEVLLRIENTLVSGGTYIYSMATDTIDSLFESTLGVPDFTTTITGLVGAFATNLADSVTYVTSGIATMFTLFAGIAVFIFDWFSRVVSMFLQIATIVQSILDGTSSFATGVGDIWAWIELENWIDAVPIFMLIGWFVSVDDRARRAGGWMGIFWSDISMMIAVFSFIFDMSMRVIQLVIDWAARFVTFLFPL